MSYCPKCGLDTDDDDRFCRQCGRSLPGGGGAPAKTAVGGHLPAGAVGRGVPMSAPVLTTAVTPVAAPSAPTRRRRPLPLLAALIVAQLVLAVVLVTTVGGDGCSRVEGSFVANGAPLGTFSFTPKVCRSGQRMSFFGAILLGSGPTEGGVLVIDDAVQGKLLKVELPGSCQPPDYEVCTVVEVRPAQCRKFDVKLERTSTEVNDIRLIDGHATLDCTFPEGGTLTAGVVFESCD